MATPRLRHTRSLARVAIEFQSARCILSTRRGLQRVDRALDGAMVHLAELFDVVPEVVPPVQRDEPVRRRPQEDGGLYRVALPEYSHLHAHRDLFDGELEDLPVVTLQLLGNPGVRVGHEESEIEVSGLLE